MTKNVTALSMLMMTSRLDEQTKPDRAKRSYGVRATAAVRVNSFRFVSFAPLQTELIANLSVNILKMLVTFQQQGVTLYKLNAANVCGLSSSSFVKWKLQLDDFVDLKECCKINVYLQDRCRYS